MLLTLKNILPENRILLNEPMKKHTSFKVGGPAKIMVLPESTDEIKNIISEANRLGYPYEIIGNGSNLLVKDEGTDSLIIKLGSNFSDIEVNGTEIRANAGTSMTKIAVTALSNSLTGFEKLSGIPGSFGGGIYMNAGAYGSELKDVLKEVTYLTRDGEIKTTPKEELTLLYRHTSFMENKDIVLSAVITLEKGDIKEIRSLMEETSKKRMDKQPLEYPSAGSTFKRPVGDFAGKLIEDAGLKGYSYGGARVSEKHAGFIINDGTATASDILKLMDIVTEKVFELYGVTLEPEVQII